MQRKKLIEVALPLDAVNRATTREKLVRHGHPSALHPWRARRPQAAARAVIFAQMVDDPSEYVDELLADRQTRLAVSRELQRLGKSVATEAASPISGRASTAVLPDLVAEAIAHVRRDAIGAGLPDDGEPLRDDGTGATAYAEAVGVYLAFALSRLADRGSTICTWSAERESIRSTFVRQAIPTTWDYAEFNPIPGGAGGFPGAIRWIADSIAGATMNPARIDTPRGVSRATAARSAGNRPCSRTRRSRPGSTFTTCTAALVAP